MQQLWHQQQQLEQCWSISLLDQQGSPTRCWWAVVPVGRGSGSGSAVAGAGAAVEQLAGVVVLWVLTPGHKQGHIKALCLVFGASLVHHGASARD